MDTLKTVPVASARSEFADLLGRVFYAGERVVITRRNRRCAALVSIEDLELLEKLEDLALTDMAREAIARHEADGEERVSLDDVFGAGS